MRRFMSIVGLVIMCMGLGACAGLGQHARTRDVACEVLDRDYQIYGALAVASSAVAGSSALGGLASDDAGARRAIAGVSVAVAVVGATAVFLRDAVTTDYGRMCETSTAIKSLGR